MTATRAILIWCSAACLLPVPLAARQAFTTDDMLAIENLSEPVFTPDGAHVTYVVTGPGDGDSFQSDLWSADWQGGDARPLFPTLDRDEYSPAWSADGSMLAFLRSGADGAAAQLWVSIGGASPRKVGDVPGGVNEFALAPDGRTAIVVTEVGAHVDPAEGTPPPIVITRFSFKEDGRGYLDDRRTHLFRMDLASGTAVQLTSGDFDVFYPAISPDGSQVAYVSRQCDPSGRRHCSDVYVMPTGGGGARRISTFEGEDADYGLEGGGPQWSPDGSKLVWLRSGPEAETWYNPIQPVVADLATGRETTPGWIDRWFYHARWSADGRAILALIEQDRDTWLARIDPASGQITYLTQGKRFAYDFAVGAGGRIAVLDGDSDTPTQLRSVERAPRILSPQNAWLSARTLATTQDVSFMSGDVEIHGLLLLPPGHQPGQRHPLVARLHGGPVYQFSHEFMADFQGLAAQGYAVLAVNPRGSTGRGAAFAQAQMARWGTVDADDISAGITHVIGMGVADPDAIGVAGWSYGGILSNYMIASDPRVKAAVAGAGMANFFGGYGVDQYARDYDLELGRPWENVDAWIERSYPFFHPERISAATLYLCSELDTNVPCAGSEAMYQALRSVGVPTTLVVYPGQNHGLTVPSYIRDRQDRSIAWFDHYLRGMESGGAP